MARLSGFLEEGKQVGALASIFECRETSLCCRE
jgi:hypothetical protein